jgi:hypothetical protein
MPDPTAADQDLAAACREWIKSCSCAAAASPQECTECTDAFLAAVLKRAKAHGLEIGIHGIQPRTTAANLRRLPRYDLNPKHPTALSGKVLGCPKNQQQT